MKSIFSILTFSFVLFNACNETSESKPIEPKVFVNELSYTISRTGTSEKQEIDGAGISATYFYNAYPVLSNENEKEIILAINPEVPLGVDVVSRFGFDFLMSVPTDLFLITDPNVLNTVELIDPTDYPQLLLDNDPENGRRVCLTKEGLHPDGSILIDNACAGEGWYGDQGEFEFHFTYHELFYDADGNPNIYTEGTFEAETEAITGTNETFKLSNGEFKLIIPLSLQ